MAAPATPENEKLPRRVAMNRSFTLPPKLANHSKVAEIGAADGIETLYVHPSASIIKFTIYGHGSTSRPGSSAGPPRASSQQPSGTLPWASITERTVAAGPLEIYRVPGSVSFLHSGALLHAILPRSQCWCVDGVSKFAFRVLPDTYYRIELPGETPEDLDKVEELKATLRKVLFYERTPCPFARTFNVELPEAPRERVSRRQSQGPAKKWRLDKAYSWKPEDGAQRRRSGGSDNAESAANSGDETDVKAGDRIEQYPTREVVTAELADKVNELDVRPYPKPKGLATLRSITAPPQLTVRSTPPSRIRIPVAMDAMVEASEIPALSSARLGPERLRTYQTIPTDMPPSPPDSSAGMELMEQKAQTDLEQDMDGGTPVRGHSRTSSTVAEDYDEADTVPGADNETPQKTKFTTARTAGEDSRVRDAPAESTPTQTTTREQAPAPSNPLPDPFAAIQARIIARRSIGGSTPPSLPPPNAPAPREPTLPPPSSSSPTSTKTVTSRRADSTHRSLSTHRHQQHQKQKQTFLATAIVKKACRAVFVGPPAHLVAIMLRIAARFASQGRFNFVIASPAGAKQRVPGSFDLGDLDTEDEGGDEGGEGEGWREEDGEGEDDFGVPLRSPIRLARLREGVDRDLGGERREWDVQ
ncbi:hypothetical protein LTR08_005876 [Meristemomyces frigidus]|nr:hypothetical protein LTR08_005876 [Meristemomyces frigidus]